MSEDFGEVLTFCEKLSRSEYIDYHYSLLKKKDVGNEMYQLLRNKFSNHGNGDKFLLEKIEQENDEILKGDILHILGSYKYRKNEFLEQTAEHAREFIKSKNAYLRSKGIIVLGWIGEKSDVEVFANSMSNDKDEKNRGWAASGLMQLFFHEPTIKDKALKYLQKSLETEKNYFTLSCILTSIQEIAKKRWGTLSTDKPENEDKEKIDVTKEKAERFFKKYFK